jgi:outer membrane protein TolC
VRQPVVLFRYPTNGYISLNAKVKRYDQQEDDGWELDYSNRLYAKYRQPLFVPNELKHELEEAELDLEESKLRFTADRVDIINDVVRHYYWVFELAYRNRAHGTQLAFLDSLRELAVTTAGQADTGSIDLVRIRIERTNARERLLEDRGRYRRELENLRQRLGLGPEDSLHVAPRITVTPVDIAVDTAVEKALELSPRLRRMAIWKRKEELDLASEKGYNSFRINLELTYGLEGSDRHFTRMWRDYETSGTAKMRAYVPLVD